MYSLGVNNCAKTSASGSFSYIHTNDFGVKTFYVGYDNGNGFFFQTPGGIYDISVTKRT